MSSNANTYVVKHKSSEIFVRISSILSNVPVRVIKYGQADKFKSVDQARAVLEATKQQSWGQDYQIAVRSVSFFPIDTEGL